MSALLIEKAWCNFLGTSKSITEVTTTNQPNTVNANGNLDTSAHSTKATPKTNLNVISV